MAEVLEKLAPRNLDLKGHIASLFYDNPFLEIEGDDFRVRYGTSAPEILDEALGDLLASGILKREGTRYFFAPEPGSYKQVADWCRARRGTDEVLRQQVVELEALGRLREQLAVSQQEVGAILEIVPSGVFLLDRFGHLLKSNTLGLLLLGLSTDISGVAICTRLDLDLAIALKQSINYEIEGAPPLAVTVKPFELPGNEGGVVISVQDISDRREMEAEAERLREEFFSMIRHELRKPLMTIERGLAHMADGQEAVLARTAAAHMGEMVDDMLLLTRLERDPLSVTADEEISLQFLLASSDLAFRAKAEAAAVTLQAVMPAEDVVFRGDARRLGQVVGNLLDNAIKFTPTGGCVTLRGGDREGVVWFEVADSGVGIPVPERVHVFEKFYQVHQDRSRKHGLGLGLAICQGIVAAHGGTLAIKDVATGGTRVVVQLPLEENDEKNDLGGG